MANSTEMYEWIDNTRSNHLTLGDLKEWQKGDIKDVIIWDRNFQEYGIWGGMTEEKAYKPDEFFEGNHHKVKYNGDFTWDIIFEFGDTITHPVHLDVEKEGRGRWLPMNDKYLIPNTAYSDDTRIGWRGPMMLWDDVEKGVPIHYVKPKYY